MGTKFKISVEIINDDGSKTLEPITVEKEIHLVRRSRAKT